MKNTYDNSKRFDMIGH